LSTTLPIYQRAVTIRLVNNQCSLQAVLEDEPIIIFLGLELGIASRGKRHPFQMFDTDMLPVSNIYHSLEGHSPHILKTKISNRE